MEGLMWRHHPQANALARLVGSGELGRLRLVRAAFSFQLAAVHGDADARFDPALDGGSLMDVGCYCVSALRLVAGEPISVRAERLVGPSGVDVVLAAVLRFDHGVVGHLDCGFVLPYRDELEVVGDVASVFLDDPWHAHAPVLEVRREPEPDRIVSERIEVATADAYRLELENLAAAVAGRAPLLLGRDDAIGQARVLDALHRSAESGLPVDL
jgi:predicted dehydrogenase